MDRISTGNRQADLILGGGFPARSINVVMGTPGSGKTVLCEQLAFANLGTRPVLYLTTISEPLSKVLTYLQEFSFAKVEAIGTAILYESIGESVIANPQALPERVTGLVEQHRPAVIVFDSFKAIGDLMPDLTTWRKVLFDLAGTLSAYDTTTFWIGEYVADMVPRLPEFAIADAILELTREQQGTRDDRYLHVLKLRGSAFLDGFHAFRISKDGLEIYPRLVSSNGSGSVRTVEQRLTTGIDGLDSMIETGWLRGTSTVVAGPAGVGKTLLGLHFLREGVRHAERGVMVTFHENPTQLSRICASLGWNPDERPASGALDVFYTSLVELQIDAIVAEIFRRIEVDDIRRLVIDSLGDLISTSRDLARFRDYVYALVQRFAAQNVTALLMLEPNRTAAPDADITPMVDNIVLLEMQLGDTVERTIRLTKTRGSAQDGHRYPIRVTAAGMVVDRMR